MNLAVAILGLAFLILIHEAGHFFVALAVKMRPRRFYVFFPPPLVKRVRNGIEYGIGSIPLGGYVKIPGMHRPAARDLESHLARALEEAPWLARHVQPVAGDLGDGRLEDARTALPGLRGAVERAELSEAARRSAERALTDVEDALSPEAYWRAPAWKRIAVIFAGPATNLVFAVALLATVFMLGVPAGVSRTVAQVDEDKPAGRFLMPGDEIVAIGGRPVEPREISETIRASNGKPLRVTVRRGGKPVTFTARPVKDGATYRLGFALEPVYKSYGPAEAVVLAVDRTWLVTKVIVVSLARLVTGSGREDISSPVGIVQVSTETLEIGFREYLALLSLISLSLALLNLLPLLPLDGGHIAFSIVERIRGRAIPREAYERVSAIGIAVVLLLFMIGLSNDIGRLT